MSKHAKQHYVPQGYLSAWTDPSAPEGHEPYVWVFQKEGDSGRKKAPKNVFWEADMYTIPLPGGGRDLRLEHGLQTLETEFAKVRRRILSGVEMTDYDRAILCMFAAALHARTASQRDHIAGQWGNVLDKMRKMDEHFRGMSPEQLAALPPSMPATGESISMEDVELIVDRPLQASLIPAIEMTSPILAEMNLTLAWTDDEQGFITSDAPCVFFDPEVHSRPFPYNSIGFAWKTLEINLPLAPRVSAFFSWQELPGRLDVSGVAVAELNRRTRFTCHEEFVNNTDSVDPYWFDRMEHLAPSSEEGAL